MNKRLIFVTVVFLTGITAAFGQGKPQCPQIVLDDPEFYLNDVGDSIIGIRDSKDIWRFYHLVSGRPVNNKKYKSPLSQKPHFNSGVCPVQQIDNQDQWLLLKKDGSEIVLPKNVSFVSNFQDGLALAKIDYVGCYIDVTGKKVFPHLKPNLLSFILDVRPLRFNRRAYDDGNEYKRGFIDKTGKIVIPAKYDKVRDFTDDLAIVKEDNTLKVIDVNGRVISTFPEKYKRDIEYMKDFVNGVTIVTDDDTGKPVLIDKNMNVVTSFYHVERGFYKDGGSDALAIVKQTENGPYIFVNTKGEYVADAFINDDRTTSDGKVEKRTGDPHDNIDPDRSWEETGFIGMGYELVNSKIGFAHGRSIHSFNCNYYQIGTFDKSGFAHSVMYEVVGHGKQDLDGSTYEIKEPHHVIMNGDGAPMVEIVVPKK